MIRFDRRIPMFAALSVVCFLLSTVAADKYVRVPIITGCVYAGLSLLFLIDWLARSYAARHRSGD